MFTLPIVDARPMHRVPSCWCFTWSLQGACGCSFLIPHPRCSCAVILSRNVGLYLYHQRALPLLSNHQHVHVGRAFQKGIHHLPRSCTLYAMHTQTYTHMLTHTCIHRYIHTFIHTCIHTCMHTYIHTCKHAYMHTYPHTHSLTRTQTYTYIHTYIHMSAFFFPKNKFKPTNKLPILICTCCAVVMGEAICRLRC